MATVIINGRQMQLPDAASDDEIRQVGGIKPGRTLIKRERGGNFIIPRGSRTSVKEGDVFIDAPARIKG